ncbi:hypothetical protein ACFW04_014449 [Cataglyphis niger]
MHDILCGVSKYIWNQWIASDSKSCFKLNKIKQDTINKRLSLIKPIQDIHRLPESLHDRAKWKASSCLNGFLNQDAFTHYSLLVSSLYILLKTKITAKELPNRIDQQMSEKFLELLHFLTDNIDYCDVSAVRDYCTNLFQSKHLSKCYTYDDNNVVFIGKCYKIKCDNKMYKAYKKCIVRHVVFHSQKYRIAKRTNSTMIHSNKPFNVSYMDRVESADYIHNSIVPISDVKSKVIHVDVGYCRYLCKLRIYLKFNNK